MLYHFYTIDICLHLQIKLIRSDFRSSLRLFNLCYIFFIQVTGAQYFTLHDLVRQIISFERQVEGVALVDSVWRGTCLWTLLCLLPGNELDIVHFNLLTRPYLCRSHSCGSDLLCRAHHVSIDIQIRLSVRDDIWF